MQQNKILRILFLLLIPSFALANFETDRPTKTRTPYAVGPKKIMLETEFANYSMDDEQKLYTNKLFEFLIRYGLSEKSELLLNTTPYLNERKKLDGRWDENSGLTNTFLGYKHSLKSGNWVTGLIPYVVLPTSSANLEDKRVYYGFSIPTAFKLPGQWNGNAMLEINNGRQDHDLDWQMNYITTLSFNHPVFNEDLLGYIEIFNESSGNEQSNATTLDLVLQYTVTENVKVDMGTYIGLSPAANDEEYFIGGSFFF